MKKLISVLLMACLVFTTVISAGVFHRANAAEETQDVKKYHLDIGFQQAWYIDDKWESDTVNSYQPGKEITVTSTIDLGKVIKSAKLLTVGQADFPFYVDDTHSMNYTDFLKDRTTYIRNYSKFISTKITPASAVPDGTKITITYKVLLNSQVQFDLAEKLKSREDSEEYLYGLLGGKNAVQTYQPEIYKRFEDSYNNGLPAGTEAFMYFTPTVIEYVEEEAPIPEEAPQAVPPADSNGCSTTIKWSEVKSHTYTVGSGENKVTRTCNHVYTYQSTLTSTATITPSTLKSGYGFAVVVNNTITTKQISNAGACGKSLSKANSNIPVPPQRAEVRTGWIVKNPELKTTQTNITSLSKIAQTATTSKFECAPSKVSHYKEKKIYTDVALAGTAKKPAKHNVSIVIGGGGVNGVEFCNTLTKQITINGNMYEDDFTVDTR